MQRGASMTTDKHVDPAVAPSIIEEESQESLDIDIPEGALRFNLSAEDIKEAMMEVSHEVCPHTPSRYMQTSHQQRLEDLTYIRFPQPEVMQVLSKLQNLDINH